jgi:hypothetical protein
MNDILLTGAVAIVTASAIWDFIKFIINRKDGKKSELGGIKKAIETLSDKVDRNQAILARTHILRFDDELINGVEHSKEYFSQQLQDIDTYEAYCQLHPDFKNNYAVIASEHIKKTYKELLEKGEWKHE